MNKKTATLLLNFGGPTSLDEVRPFLRNIFKDPAILPIKPGLLRNIVARFISMVAAKSSRNKYRQIGGLSPLAVITMKQVSGLEDELRKRGESIPVFAGMRYGKPSINNTVLDIIGEGIKKLIVLPLYPHYSITTTESAFRELDKSVRALSCDIDVSLIASYEEHPGYIEALADKLLEQYEAAKSEGEEPSVIFSAHSLPARLVEKDRRYLDGIRRTAELVAEAVKLEEFNFAYQSGQAGWLGPAVEETLAELAGKGCKSFIVVPLSFTCDNIETLYDIDIKLQETARKLGVKLRRTGSLNDSPGFIRALADIVADRLEK